MELNNNFMGWPIHPLYWFTYLKLLISSALKAHFYKRNWQSKNEWKKWANIYQIWSSMAIHSSFVRNVWISATPRVSSHPFTYPHVWTLSNSLLSMMKALLALVIQLSLCYPHVSDKAQMNNHQASYLVWSLMVFP